MATTTTTIANFTRINDDPLLLSKSDMANLENIDVTPLQQMISSCTGSFLTSLLVTPLDVVKIRLQAQQKEFMKNKCFLYCNGLMDHVCFCLEQEQKNNKSGQAHHSTMFKNLRISTKNGNSNCCNNYCVKSTPGKSLYHSISVVKHLTDKQIHDLWYRRPNYFNGTLDAMIKITKNEGITSLWSGLPPTLVMAIPATVMYFTIYDQLVTRLRRYFQTDRSKLSSITIPTFAGGSARLVAATVISPLEMIRTKMQSQKLSYKEIGTAVQQLVRNEGILRLWTGLNATLLRDVPFSMLYWLNYENFKRVFQMYDYHFGFSFIAGATSGAIAATITLPFDVVKTHRQIELGQKEISKSTTTSSNNKQAPKKTLDIMIKIYQERGYQGLFAGITPRLIKVAPACAIMISTYEAGKSFFRQYNYSKMLEHQQKLRSDEDHQTSQG